MANSSREAHLPTGEHGVRNTMLNPLAGEFLRIIDTTGVPLDHTTEQPVIAEDVWEGLKHLALNGGQIEDVQLIGLQGTDTVHSSLQQGIETLYAHFEGELPEELEEPEDVTVLFVAKEKKRKKQHTPESEYDDTFSALAEERQALGENEPLLTDEVRVYLQEIARIPLLSRDKEDYLARRIELGKRAERLLKTANATKGDFEIYLRGEKERAKQKQPKFKDDTTVGNWVRRADEARKNLEEVADFAIYQQGKKAAREFTEANLRLVTSIAKKYVGRGMSMIDLIGEGNIGLIRAVNKYDRTKGFRFSTYATWWIRQAVTRAIADQARAIRLPVYLITDINKMMRVRYSLLNSLKREPTQQEIADEMGIKVDKVKRLDDARQEPVSLSLQIGDDEDATIGTFIPDDGPSLFQQTQDRELTQVIRDILGELTPAEREVIQLRFGLGEDGKTYTLEQVGKKRNVTRERIRQIEARVLRMLRHPQYARRLKPFN